MLIKQFTSVCRGYNAITIKKTFLHTTSVLNTKVALVLSGCGVYDGSEVHEASSTLIHLSRSGADVGIFAPNIDQMHAIDHTKGEPMDVNRNVMVESARIARGNIKPLADLSAKDFDAIIFPGGFGAAKNLSTYAVDGDKMKINPDVEKIIKEFHSSKKPIGLCCIAPVLAAKSIPGCSLTVGSDQEEGGRWPYAGTAGAIQSMGASHVKKDVTEIHVDAANKIVTTPAFMCETAFHHIYDGIGNMVKGVLELCGKK